MYVELRNLNKQFNGFKAADNVSFGIERGHLAGLLGPSGSGKTTILRMLAGLETPDSGDILIDGKRVNDIPAARRGIGFVFQDYALFRYMTVFGNIAFGLTVQKKEKRFIQARVTELIKLIGLEGLERRRPHQLSGGQKQRVAFARALAPNPQLLLLDEPFAAIDAKVRKDLRSWLRETINKVGVTSIFVTHDQDEAVEVADEIVITNSGRIEQVGTPTDIYKNPQTPFAAGFIGESIVVSDYGRLHGFQATDGFDQAVLRPEFVRAVKLEKEVFPHASQHGTVQEVYFRGNALELRINLGGQVVTSHQSLEEEAFKVGEEVSVLIYRLYLLGRDSVRLMENASIKSDGSFFI
ncbi:MAG: ATP-binding cassette domain-containing protein [Actinomycetia bacterium]|nr:ATP-binding cassette domain-containing protein [Actinomycetes bacterium]